MSDPLNRPVRGVPARRVLVLAVALATLMALALAGAPSAAAGTYRAVQCHEPLGAGHGDAVFWSTSNRYASSADCHGKGLGIVHRPGESPTGSGRFGAWALTAPAATQIVRLTARVSADAASWHVPRMFVAVAGGARNLIAGIRGGYHGVGWAGTAGRSLTARLVCVHTRRCGDGYGAHIHIRRISVTLHDSSAPSLEAGGSLLASGSRRGTQTLDVAAHDVGAGVRTVTVEVNGAPVAARILGCAIVDGVAIRLRPCPAGPFTRFEVATATSHFRQGPNRVRVCAADYAPHANVNRTCETHGIRVDNLCPVSAVPGWVLRARFQGAGERLTTRADRAATVTGSVLGPAGAPVAGAEVCVATRARADDYAERVVATPTTDARGRFSIRLPAGPSRDVRVAHWPGAERALERHLTLRARAAPRLRLRPDRPLRNGQRVRFRVHIPGPANGGRRVAVQARAGGRWVRVDGGRTSRAGTWRGRYRFRSTTATRRYAFRAIVRRQPGYPYETGRSKIRHATVEP